MFSETFRAHKEFYRESEHGSSDKIFRECNRIRSTNHKTPGGFENGGCSLKTLEMFFVHTTTDELEKGTMLGHLGFVSQKNPVSEIT